MEPIGTTPMIKHIFGEIVLNTCSILGFTAPRPVLGVLNPRIEFADSPQKVEA
jgi:hypothetical protein